MSEPHPTDWFDHLYRQASVNGEGVPWANMETHPSLRLWLQEHPLHGQGASALVVGCGMGDDAVELLERGFDVTAFDVSEAAIGYCRERFGARAVRWTVADLLNPPAAWSRHFDLVLEIYTIQSLPPRCEEKAIHRIADFVAPGGRLLTIAIASDDAPRTLESGPPWILRPSYVDGIQAQGLDLSHQMIHEQGSRRGDVSIAMFQRPPTQD